MFTGHFEKACHTADTLGHDSTAGGSAACQGLDLLQMPVCMEAVLSCFLHRLVIRDRAYMCPGYSTHWLALEPLTTESCHRILLRCSACMRTCWASWVMSALASQGLKAYARLDICQYRELASTVEFKCCMTTRSCTDRLADLQLGLFEAHPVIFPNKKQKLDAMLNASHRARTCDHRVISTVL